MANKLSLAHHFEACEDGALRPVSSDSWTLGTPDSSSPSMSQEEDLSGGGEREGAPNTWAGGSHPGAHALRSMHGHLADFVLEELEHVDVTSPEQALWMPILSQAILKKAALEEALQQHSEGEQEQVLDQVAQEFLVTKTISNKDVWDNLEDWAPSIEAEFNQLVHSKKAVVPITKEQLLQKAQDEGREIEILPSKMVFARKAGSGAFRSRAVVCGNYSSSRNEDERYAGGADGCQVRTMLRTAALKQWKVAGCDVRVAFLNAPRRSDNKLVAMEVPAVFRKLGLSGPGELWWIHLAMYGLVTSPRDWCLHRDSILPKLTWKRLHQGSEVFGHFEKSVDDNIWRLIEQDASGNCSWQGLMAVYVDDILLTGEDATMEAALQALSAEWAISAVEWATTQVPVKFCGFEILLHPHGGLKLSQAM